ncbi:MAG: UDP-N-acetylglucosamine pyrophosphorylase [Lachnospiraceae bacterium]|jgi:NDP-sugar pyrophosphorylase family protein|nr:UDP-N-acetylglucosamine pyrophosphorylase [Lachnospiraceae bacterium]
MNEINAENLFDLEKSIAGEKLGALEYPWQALSLLEDWIIELGNQLSPDDFTQIAENIWVAKNAKVAVTASLNGPLIVGAGSEIRHGAFIRGNVIIGSDCVIGNATEVKNSLLFDGVQIPHFNYIGDSILGHKAHLGAGAVIANTRSDHGKVMVRWGDRVVATELYKMGAMVGDRVEVGCNAVICPGTIVGRGATIYPLTMVKGLVTGGSVVQR